MNFEIVYYPAGPLDTLLEMEEAFLGQHEYQQIRANKAAVAVEIVNSRLKSDSYMQINDAGTVNLIGGMEVAQCDIQKYTKESYWKGVFDKEHCSISYWNSLFQEDRKYTEVNLAERIPDDKYQCMVFHRVHKWSERFRQFFCDGEVSVDRKVAVLEKQIRNIAFFSKERAFGSFWHTASKPDDTLKQPLAGGGDTAPVRDSDRNQQTDIPGSPGNMKSSGFKSDGTTGDGPKVDELDRKIYTSVRTYAAEKIGSEPPNKWTMARSSFITDGKEFRCYAFSGSRGSNKQLHTMPAKWWEENQPYEENRKENIVIYLCNVDKQLLGQNLILAVFSAFQESIKEDLKALTSHIAFDDKPSSQSLILGNRNDLVTLDYGEYYDNVMSRTNSANESIKRALTNNAYLKTNFANTEKLVEEILPMVSVCGENKQYKPNLEELKTVKCLDQSERAVHVIGSISEDILDKLERKLTKLPTEFLNEMKGRLKQCHCGEDNVLSLLLQKYLETVTVFGTSPVEFVALDGDSPGGKPFCEVCDRKVRFYSVLPTFLQELGVSGNDQEFLRHLTTLFAKMAENP